MLHLHLRSEYYTIISKLPLIPFIQSNSFLCRSNLILQFSYLGDNTSDEKNCYTIKHFNINTWSRCQRSTHGNYIESQKDLTEIMHKSGKYIVISEGTLLSDLFSHHTPTLTCKFYYFYNISKIVFDKIKTYSQNLICHQKTDTTRWTRVKVKMN